MCPWHIFSEVPNHKVLGLQVSKSSSSKKTKRRWPTSYGCSIGFYLMCLQSGWRSCQSTPQCKIYQPEGCRLETLNRMWNDRDDVFTTWKSRHRRQPRTKHFQAERHPFTVKPSDLPPGVWRRRREKRRGTSGREIQRSFDFLTDWGSRRLCCDERLESAEELERKGPRRGDWSRSVLTTHRSRAGVCK